MHFASQSSRQNQKGSLKGVSDSSRRDTLAAFYSDRLKETPRFFSGTLRILDSYQFADGAKVRDFVLQAQCPVSGGLGKWDASNADPMHSYLGLAGLSFVGKDKLQEVFVPLNVSLRTHKALKKIHDSWDSA